MDTNNITVRLADAGAAFSMGGWLFLHAAEINFYLGVCSTLVVIIAGACAAYYHIKLASRIA